MSQQRRRHPYDVYVLGAGMVGYRQFTRETEAALEKSETVFLVHSQEIVAEYVEREFTDDVISLIDEYEPTVRRDETYERMAERVLETAEEADDPVSFLLYGHPMIYVSPADYVLEEGPERGLDVQALPGISSMDCLYTDIGLDPAANGIQMFEATDLLLREFELNPDVPAMLWQIGSLETVLYSTAPSRPERFTRLREYLEQFYPEDHTLSLLRTATYPITDSERVDFELRNFEDVHDEVTATQTLYIPPVRERPVQNEELSEQVTSEEHLERITYADQNEV